MTHYDLVIPTIGRESLQRLLDALSCSRGPKPHNIVLVDDRRDSERSLRLPSSLSEQHLVCIVATGGRGPAAARNAGARVGTAEWLVFLDDDVVPDPGSMSTPELRQGAERALAYMNLTPGTAIRDIAVDTVFIGSCTNGRLADLRAAAEVIRGRQVSPRVRALVVPGSARVKAEAEAEGLDQAFTDAGFEWRSAGCSMCLGMNGDILAPGERSASTSNRNFEGRQGPGGRTHLVSPAVAAATAVAGHFTLPGDL